MFRLSTPALSVTLLLLIGSASSSAATDPYVYTVIDVPFSGAVETEVFGVSNAGDMVGSYEDADGVRQGFVRKNCVFETLTVPGATNTRAFGINEAGQITGRYRNDDLDPSVQHGFLRQPDGTVVDVDFPGQTFNFAWGINDPGQVSGYYFEFPPEGIFITSFRREPDGAFIPILFSFLGAGNVFRGINNAGVHVGWYLPDQEGQLLIVGLTFATDVFTPFQIPGDFHTLPDDINNLGQIVGHAASPAFSTVRGFLRDTDGAVTFIDPPGAVEAEALGINDFGLIVGAFETASEELHGFLATPIPVSATEQLQRATTAAAIPELGKRNLLGALDRLLGRLTRGQELLDRDSANTMAGAKAKFLSARHQLRAYERLVKHMARHGRITEETATALLASADALETQLKNLLAVLGTRGGC